MGRLARIVGLAGLCALATGLVGCQGGPEEPRARLGSLPFPGPFTLYCVADPANLGMHRYEPVWQRLGELGENCSRGTLYTCGAGFLDLAHLRESADWVKFVHDRTREGLEGKRSEFTFTWSDTEFVVRVIPPKWLANRSEQEREELIEETAIRFGHRMSVVVGTWHEIATWYGQETIPPISEQRSAFTWDDGCSHVVGAMVGARALRSGDADWDRAVTAALRECVDELGVVSPAWQGEAVRRVRGRWWKGVEAIRRDLQTGLESGRKNPWLVADLECCEGATEAELPVPDLGDVKGWDMRAVAEFELRPPAWLMRDALGCEECPGALVGEAPMLAIIERIRGEMKAEWGEEADQP